MDDRLVPRQIHSVDIDARLPIRDLLGRRPAAPHPVPPAPFSPRFLVASLVVTLTLGAGSGMLYLWRIGAGADVPLSHRQIHGHSQVLGFVALFLFGIAFHALPRMFGARPASDRLQRVVLWSMLGGVLARNIGQPFAGYGFGRALSLLSGPLEATSGTLFALFVLFALSTAKDAGPIVPFLRLGTISLLAALALSVVQGSWIAGHLDATLPGSLTEPFYVLSLFGFVLSWVFGFASRMVPAFLGTGPAHVPLLRACLLALASGVALESGSFALSGDTAALARDAGRLLAAAAVLLFIASLGVLWRSRKVGAPRVAGAPDAALRAAFAFLALWAALRVASVLLGRFTSWPASNPWWTDAARHVFTVGFLMLLMIAIGFRVVPVFSGRTLWSPRLARVTWILVAVGAAMRLLQYPAAFQPDLYRIGSLMGVPVVSALVLFAVNLRKTMKGASKSDDEHRTFEGTLPSYQYTR